MADWSTGNELLAGLTPEQCFDTDLLMSDFIMTDGFSFESPNNKDDPSAHPHCKSVSDALTFCQHRLS